MANVKHQKKAKLVMPATHSSGGSGSAVMMEESKSGKKPAA